MELHRLKAALVAKNWTQSELAARLGISAPFVSQILSGEAKPSFELAPKILRELGISEGEAFRIFLDEKLAGRKSEKGSPVVRGTLLQGSGEEVAIEAPESAATGAEKKER